MMPSASIVIPTRDRLPYLEVALRSIAEQAFHAGVEVLVIDDAGLSSTTRSLVERFGARYEPHSGPLGLNVARNTGVRRSSGELVAFLDDDVRASTQWLRALLDAAGEHADVDVFAGPIRASFEGAHWRSCGREQPPITTLDLGPQDTDARYAWGANMAIRRAALERVGPFDESLGDGGDEQEWQDRFRSASGGSGRVLYVAEASVQHRRAGRDARLRSLSRAAAVRGRAARSFDASQDRAPSLQREWLTLAGCAGHIVRYGCAGGVPMVAHSAGRLRQGLRERAGARVAADAGVVGAEQANGVVADDFLSGASGTVGGLDALLRAARDTLVDAGELASGQRARLALAALRKPLRRKVLVLSIERAEHRALAEAARAELARSRHDVELLVTAPQGRGKFENLNRLLAQAPADGHDWLIVLDDDVELPRGFLDRFLFLSERFELSLAQPAHRLNSHAAWPQTRRQPGSIVRETHFVEIGPVTAFAAVTFSTLLPFPELRMGWGLDAHWAAVAQQHGWRCGVTDAVAIGHRVAPAADAYSREEAVAEARAFLAGRPYVSAQDARRTVTTHRRW
jgi:GT2 family glycosyltransferase